MPATPRPAPIAGLVSPYVTECRLLRAYDRLLRAADLDALAAACFTRKLPQAKADERLEYIMPELIRKLTPEQQPALVALLLAETPDLAGAVQELARLENGMHRRDDDPRLRISDEGRMKAAGMGHLSRAVYGKALPLGPPLVLEALRVPAPRKPALRAKKRRTPQRRSCRVLVGQYCIWPPVAGGGVSVGGL